MECWKDVASHMIDPKIDKLLAFLGWASLSSQHSLRASCFHLVCTHALAGDGVIVTYLTFVQLMMFSVSFPKLTHLTDWVQ